jgi:hypothetical protein
MDCPATRGSNRLYSAALKASLLIASPLLYLIFVAIIAFRDRVRMNALMHQRVVALNLAPLSCGKFRFAKSKQYLAPSRPSSSTQSSSADVSRHSAEAELRKPVSCNESIAAVLADNSVEGDRCIAVPAATRAIVTRAEITWRFMGSLRSAPTIS